MLCLPSLCLVAGWLLVAGTVAAETPGSPYQDFGPKGVRFHGPGRDEEPPDTLSAVRLGLTCPAAGRRGQELRAGVQLAVDQANAGGGYRGLPYQVVFRPDDESWSVVAAQVVRLIQEDGVWAVIGSLDGERAHAAELVVAKLWAPVITPGAADITIDYANVPWVFRLMPPDRAQADVLLDRAKHGRYGRIALATAGTRDGRLAADRVLESAQAREMSLHLHVEFDPYNIRPAVTRLTSATPDALLLWSEAPAAVSLLRALRQRDVDIPVLVPSHLVGPELADPDGRTLGPLLGAAPFDMTGARPALRRFRRAFRQATGREATHIAAYGYDAARLLIQGCMEVGLNRVRLCDWLLAADREGVTGHIAFNSLGGSLQRPLLVELRGKMWRRP